MHTQMNRNRNRNSNDADELSRSRGADSQIAATNRTGGARRISPDIIDALEDSEIFVFGSNIYGMHGGGAAAVARKKFGAVMGCGEGLQGRSYALPTMEGFETMRTAVNRFIAFARTRHDLKFLVTAVGCGIAGYNPAQVAPLFADAVALENVYLPASFWDVLL